MFCPECGAESTQGLNYCKRCGTTLSASSVVNQPRPKSIPPLVPLSLVSMVGLIGFFATLIALANTKIDERVLIAVAIFGGATVFGVIGLLIRISKQQLGSHPLPASDDKRGHSTQPQLISPPLVVSSVTEHTTRNFDPQLQQRNTDR